MVVTLVVITLTTAAASLDSLVKANNLNATVVVTSLKTGNSFTYNEARANVPFLPASTFKIPNTLIALQEGAIKGLNDTIRWDGTHRFLAEWNHDQDLASAFPLSCVWFYQELASRIGNDTYLDYLDRLNYGNRLTGPNLRTFWLDGDIRISALQQIAFIKNLYLRQFSFSDQHYDMLRRVMLTDSTSKYRMYAKTGWTARVEVETGWYVGYVETDGDIWFFACNLEIREATDARFRKELPYQYLRDLKIIPEQSK